MFIFTSTLLIYTVTNTYGELVDPSNLRILLYTQQNSEVAIQLQTANLRDIDFFVTNQVKIIMHGWNDNADSSWVTEMKNAYLQQGHTIIFIDWSYYSTNRFCWPVIDFVQGVGNIIGNLVVNLLHIFGVQLLAVECIGHSLGAHGCGFAGKNVIESIDQKIGNITGLDPAGEGYEGIPSPLRLDANDAHIVKILHTNAGEDGIIQAIGRVDFYPNGGHLQPNCLATDRNCSHYASIQYWIDGISNNLYVGTKCSSYTEYQLGLCHGNPTAIMGEGTDASALGVFFLNI